MSILFDFAELFNQGARYERFMHWRKARATDNLVKAILNHDVGTIYRTCRKGGVDLNHPDSRGRSLHVFAVLSASGMERQPWKDLFTVLSVYGMERAPAEKLSRSFGPYGLTAYLNDPRSECNKFAPSTRLHQTYG